MKYLCFFICGLSLLCTYNSQAQCEPVFVFDYGEFQCSNSGTFCAKLNSDENPDCIGEDWVIQFEFPKDDFQEVQWNGFERIRDDTLETWQDTVEWISGNLDQEYCFRGTLSEENMVMIVRFIKIDTSGRDTNTYSFPLKRNLPVIGNGGTVFLSNLVGNQLLSAQDARTQAQQFTLNGTLIIDQSYTFGTNITGSVGINEIYMEPGSEIIVQQNNTLGFNRAKLTSCSTWKGIDINTGGWVSTYRVLIERAERALEMDHLATVSLRATLLHNNGYGIYSNLPTLGRPRVNLMPSPIFGGIESIIFDTDDNNPFGYNVGIYFRNARNLNMDGWVRFNNLNIGVDMAIGENLHIGGINFIRHPSFYNCGDGIYINRLDNAAVTATFDAIEKRGILFSEIQDLDVQGSEFYQCDIGIYGRTSQPNEHVRIDSNTFDQVNNAVIGILRPGRGEIQYNDISSSKHSIIALGLGSGKHNWAIQNNNDITSVDQKSIWLRRTIFTRIHENSNIQSGGDRNIHIQGGHENYAGCNNLISAQQNININGSDMFDIYCNDASSTGNSNVSIENNCGRSIVRTAFMTSPTYNLEYDDMAMTGHQVDRGNLFDSSSTSVPKAINSSIADLASRNQFIVGNILYCPGGQGSECFPYFTSAFADWFDDLGGAPDTCAVSESCLPPGIIGGPNDTVRHNENAKLLYDYVITGLANDNGISIDFDAQYKLMKSLLVLNDQNAIPPSLQQYFINNQNTEAYHLAYVEHQLANEGRMSTADQQSWESATTNLNQLVGQYRNVTWYSIDTIADTIIYHQDSIDLRDTLLQQINQLNAQISSLRSTYSTQWTSELSAMLTYLGSISTTTTAGSNLKAALDVYIRYSLSGEHILSGTDANTIHNIATQCYREGGDGVFLARNLESSHLGTISDYSDDCSATQPLQQGGKMEYAINAFPTPANNDRVYISVPDISKEIIVKVVDMYGREQLQITTGSFVNITNWPTGTYYIIPMEMANNVHRGLIIKN